MARQGAVDAFKPAKRVEDIKGSESREKMNPGQLQIPELQTMELESLMARMERHPKRRCTPTQGRAISHWMTRLSPGSRPLMDQQRG